MIRGTAVDARLEFLLMRIKEMYWPTYAPEMGAKCAVSGRSGASDLGNSVGPEQPLITYSWNE